MKYSKANYLVILFLLSCLLLKAQSDSSRIIKFENTLQIGLFYADNYASTQFTSTKNSNTLTPIFATKPSIGFQLAYNGAIIALGNGFSIPSARYQTSDYKITDAINLNGYFSRTKYVLWGAIKRFEGAGYATQFQVPNTDATFFNLSGSYMHIFNENNYSFRAAFRQVEQQVSSGGSFLLKGIFNHINLSDSNLVTIDKDNFTGFQTNGFSFLGGYAYNLNLTQNLFLSTLLLVGVDLQRVQASSFTPNMQYSFAHALDFKSVIGYNSPRYYMALVFSYDNRLSLYGINEAVDFTYNYIKTDLRFGIRIKAPDVLKKVPFIN